MKKKPLLIAVIILMLMGTAMAFVGVVKARDNLVAAKSQFIFPQVLAVFQHENKATQAYADHMGDLRSAFTLPWSVIGSGGMGGSAGDYTIHSTLGQPVAGAVTSEPYHLTSGFWTEVFESILEFFNFLPLIIK